MQGKGKTPHESHPTQKHEPKQTSEDDFDEIPPELEQALQFVPKESRREIYGLMVSSMTRSPEADIAKKVTSEHISQMLETQKRSMDYSFQDNKMTKMISLIVFILTLVFIGVLIVLLKEKPDILEKILTILVSGGLGAFGGYGFGKNSKD